MANGISSGGRPLRFGVMCDGEQLAAWQIRCIEELLRVEGVEPALLIVKEGDADSSGRARFRLPRRRDKVLWRLYRRTVLDRRSRSTRMAPLPAALAKLPSKRCRVGKVGRFAEQLQAEDIEDIRRYELDFIIRFGFGILKGAVLEAPRFGIWSFHHGDPEHYRGMPPGFWEIHDGVPVTGAILQRLTERLDAGVLLYKGYFKTDRASYLRGRDDLFFGAADWPARICKDIQQGVADYLEASPLASSGPIKREPGNREMLRFLARQASGWSENQYRSLFQQQQWTVGITNAPVHAVAGLSKGWSQPVQWLAEPKGRFLADPFAVERQDGSGDLLVLAEDYDWAAARGRISALTVADGRASAPQLLFDLPCHMSYPYLFRHAGQLFCVPETNELGKGRLYVLDERSREWREECVLVRGRRLLDSTIFHHGDRWWLLASDEENGANNKLHAWMAPDLRGPWSEHPANPLKTDVRSSRPAGRPFLYEGELYRPGQDCSRVYGGAIAINRVVELTLRSFREETVHMLRPRSGWRYGAGLHTLCEVGERTVIDACRESFAPRAFTQALERKFGVILRKLGIARG